MSIFKAYDIRGIYQKELTNKDAYMIGYYFIKKTNLKIVKIAHDKRLSYENLAKYLIKGIKDANSQVEYLGLSSTVNFYFSLFKGVNNGIMITASHNPKEYNGFKFMINGKSFDSRNGLDDIEKLIKEDKDNIKVNYEKISKKLNSLSLIQFLINEKLECKSTLNFYVDYLIKQYEKILTKEDLKIIKKLNFSIDFSSGVSSLAISQLLKKKKLNPILFNNVIDGNFPYHSPDPQKAQKFIHDQKDLGYFCAVFDGDGDRLVFYDENKDIILQDYIIAIYLDFFSKNSNKFVSDLRVSKSILDMAKKENFDIKLMRVGRAFYQDYMKENNCEFGAELSGHLFFKEFNYLDNPDIGLLYMLKIIAYNLKKNPVITFSQIVKRYKTYYKLEEKKYQIINIKNLFKKLKKMYNENNIVSNIDGLSFDLEDFWFNIRVSNTEPVVKLNFEAKNKEIFDLELLKLENLIQNC